MADPTDSVPDELREYCRIFCTAVRKMLLVKGAYDLSREPQLVKKEIVSFCRRLRVDGLEKFGVRTVFSVIKFYRDNAHLDHDQPLGAMILFVETDHLARLLWSLEYPRIDEDDDAVLLDACGTLANLVAGYFVKELNDRGYVHLQMSHFESYFNTAVNGIAFDSDETGKYEISFTIKGEKRLVAELTMSHLPRIS
jgi:hypothetical protein